MLADINTIIVVLYGLSAKNSRNITVTRFMYYMLHKLTILYKI